MAKKKNSDSVVPASKETEYETGEWAGSPHYRCKLCLFDTLAGLDVMLTHLVERHSSDAALNTLFSDSTVQTPEGDPTIGINEVLKEANDATNELK